jgi:hypothetical protein
MSKRKAISVLVLGLILMAFGAVCASAATNPSITIADQAGSNFDAENPIIVASVTSNGPGWVVIVEETMGKPGQILGYAPVVNGVNKNVKVYLSQPVNDLNEPVGLFAVLYADTAKNGAFEPIGTDKPVVITGAGPNGGNADVMKFFLLNPPQEKR